MERAGRRRRADVFVRSGPPLTKTLDGAMKNPWIKAAVVSLALSAIVTLGATILFGGGAKYVPPIEWERVGSMTYDEASKYLAERSKSISGWEAFLGAVGYPRFWSELLVGWLVLSGLGFGICAAFYWWLRRDQAPSNPALNTDGKVPPK